MKYLPLIWLLSLATVQAQTTYQKWQAEFESWVHGQLNAHPPYPDSGPNPTPAPTPAPIIGTIDLVWDEPIVPPAVSGYNLYYGKSPGKWDKWVDVGAVNTYTVTNLISGTHYYFMVRAYNQHGESVDSNQCNAIAP
jgi:hypothetical protein